MVGSLSGSENVYRRLSLVNLFLSDSASLLDFSGGLLFVESSSGSEDRCKSLDLVESLCVSFHFTSTS